MSHTPSNRLTSQEQGIVSEVMDVLDKVPLHRRDLVLSWVGTFVADEQERKQNELVQKLREAFLGFGCAIESPEEINQGNRVC